MTPTVPSYLDSELDTDSDSDVGDGSILLEDDGIVGVSESPSLVVDINQFVALVDLERQRTTTRRASVRSLIEGRLIGTDEVQLSVIGRRSNLVVLCRALQEL